MYISIYTYIIYVHTLYIYNSHLEPIRAMLASSKETGQLGNIHMDIEIQR